MESRVTKDFKLSLLLTDLSDEETKEIQAKSEKLRHYAHNPLNTFLKYDIYNFCPIEQDGEFSITETQELINPVFPVCLLVKKSQTKSDILRILKELYILIESQSEDYFAPEKEPLLPNGQPLDDTPF